MCIRDSTTAGLRFLNPDVFTTKPEFPDYLLADRGLSTDATPIAPGETKEIVVKVQDARWDIERLSDLAYDTDSQVGGLFLFFTPSGKRFAAASQAFFWVNFRLPFGAVFAALGLLIGEWINRYVNFWGWTYFPISLVFPSALIVPAIWLDVILLLSGSYVITAVVGALGWGLLFYPNNWPAIAAFHQATEQHGQLMTLADLIGLHFVRTSMPEYIRMVERGTLRTFGKDVVPVAAFFSGFVSMMVYFLWWFMGRWYSTTKVIDKI